MSNLVEQLDIKVIHPENIKENFMHCRRPHRYISSCDGLGL